MRYGMKYRAFVPNEAGSGITPGMLIKIIIYRVSDGMVYNFTDAAWSSPANIFQPPGSVLPSAVWQALNSITIETQNPTVGPPGQMCVGYEYLWTFPENISTTEAPEKYLIYYKDWATVINDGALKVDEVLYLPDSVTFDFFAISPLEVGSINMVGG